MSDKNNNNVKKPYNCKGIVITLKKNENDSEDSLDEKIFEETLDRIQKLTINNEPLSMEHFIGWYDMDTKEKKAFINFKRDSVSIRSPDKFFDVADFTTLNKTNAFDLLVDLFKSYNEKLLYVYKNPKQ